MPRAGDLWAQIITAAEPAWWWVTGEPEHSLANFLLAHFVLVAVVVVASFV